MVPRESSQSKDHHIYVYIYSVYIWNMEIWKLCGASAIYIYMCKYSKHSEHDDSDKEYVVLCCLGCNMTVTKSMSFYVV